MRRNRQRCGRALRAIGGVELKIRRNRSQYLLRWAECTSKDIVTVGLLAMHEHGGREHDDTIGSQVSIFSTISLYGLGMVGYLVVGETSLRGEPEAGHRETKRMDRRRMGRENVITKVFDSASKHKETDRVPNIMLYSHDGFGLGHLRRTVRIAQQLRQRLPGASILIVTSSPAAGHPLIPEDIDYIKLPSVTKSGTERYEPHLEMSLESVIALRSALLLTAVQSVQPDLFLVDHRPLGLKKEVLPTLEWIRASAPHIRTVVGLRDIVDDPHTVIQEWQNQGIYEALDKLYDAVLVYGDASIVDITREYALPGPVARKVRFTGYLGSGRANRTREEVRRSLGLTSERLVVVNVGGGGDGSGLIRTYLEALPLLPEDIHSHIVTGPLMPCEERDRLREDSQKPGLTFVEYQDDLASVIASADLSVSMGGYNTVCEVLTAGVPALVVPRIFPRREQHIRARRLEARGLIQVLTSTSLNADTLSAAVRSSLAGSKGRYVPVALDGVGRTADYLLSLLPDSVAPSSTSQAFRDAAWG
jgi:predicted glycosyltransferase